LVKILKYELRRLLLNKFFISLLAINGVFAWYTLASDTVAGIAFTAPFSPWSFGSYLSSVMPMITITVLFLLTFFHSKKEKQVKILTAATPVNAIRYMLIRNAAVTFGFFALSFLVVGMSFYFYVVYFDYWNFTAFIIPVIVTVIPCFVFIMGLGNCVGRIHPGFLYSLMLVTFAMNFVHLPGEFSLFGGGYYANAPLSLPTGMDGEPAFMLSAAFLVTRALYLVIGVVLLALSIRPKKQK